MAANQNDYFKKTGANTVTTLSAPGKALAASSITVGSTANYPTDTGITIGIRQVDSDGVLVAGTYTEWKATVTSGTTLAISTTPELGSDQVYPAGSTTQVFIPVSSSAHNDLIDGVLEFANQDGTLQTAPVQAALGVTTLPSGGWDILNSGTAPTVSTGYNKGNKEFDLTFANVDLSTTLSAGMRLKVDRGTTPPTQCTDLELSSSQYWSKTSPSGLSFTDDFTCEAMIKPESYATGGIVARRNADSQGWSFHLEADGRLTLIGISSAGNTRQFTTRESVPLSKWTHVAISLDMSGSSGVAYFNGASVPGQILNAGTANSLTQGTTALVVGAQKSAGTSPFDGKIADVRVWSAVRTATQIRDNMNQQLVGNETNLVAYFKFNGDGNDSTSNANNLSANGSATATNVDNPMKNTEYAIITKVSYSAPNTTVTVFTGTDHAIPNMTLGNPFYSTQKTPFGFPSQSSAWTVQSLHRTDINQVTPVSGTWYNVGGAAISIPTGVWEYGYQAQVYSDATNNPTSVYSTLSTANNSETNTENSGAVEAGGSTAGLTKVGGKITIEPPFGLELTAQTPYYLNLKTQDPSAGNIYFLGSRGATVIYAKCAYV